MTAATSTVERRLVLVILEDCLDKDDIKDVLDDLSDDTTGNKNLLIRRLLRNRFFKHEQLLPLLELGQLVYLCRQRGKATDGKRPVLEARLKEVLIEEAASFQKTSKPMWWTLIHPTIRMVAEPRFDAHQFADAVFAASTEVTARVRAQVKSAAGEELDGFKLMTRAFSGDSPLISLANLGDQSGRDEQQGYLHIFAGTVLAIRNPKAHKVIEISGVRAIHHLFLTSLLMEKLDDAGVP